MSIFRVCVMVACSLRRAPKNYPSEGNFFRVFPWRTEKAGFRFAPSQVLFSIHGYGSKENPWGLQVAGSIFPFTKPVILRYSVLGIFDPQPHRGLRSS